MIVECLPSSTLPDDLRRLGYDVVETSEGERILHSAIIERFVAGADGSLEPLTAGSTGPVASTVTHARICKGSGTLLGVEMQEPAGRVPAGSLVVQAFAVSLLAGS